MAGAATRRLVTSTTISISGSSSIARISVVTSASGSSTGTRPIFRQLLRKMSAKLGATIASNP
jgi:hypothetical protein